jgi:molybdopterin-guanine dinucleotide biosynthesis protein A
MGVDKARLPLDGWPAAVRLCERLEAAGLRATIVRRERDGLPWRMPDGRDVRILEEDTASIRHPLQGVRTAAADAGAPFFVCPCDLVDLSPASIRALCDRSAVAEDHPLVGVFAPDLAALDDAIRSGRSAQSHAIGRPRWPLPPHERTDRNQGGGPWPPERLLARHASVARLDADALVRGECARLLIRGVVVPATARYAVRPAEGEIP